MLLLSFIGMVFLWLFLLCLNYKLENDIPEGESLPILPNRAKRSQDQYYKGD